MDTVKAAWARFDGSDYGYDEYFDDGDGYGYGYGSGGGCGKEFGYGYGYGCGCDECCGTGDGNGYSYSDNDGYGEGDIVDLGECCGTGDGEGEGYGCGYGTGIKSLNGDLVHLIDGVQTIIDHIHSNIAKGRILMDDLTTKPCFIIKSNGLFAHGDSMFDARTALMDKILDGIPE